jgi:siroheme synthase
VILYDSGVKPEILGFARRDARQIVIPTSKGALLRLFAEEIRRGRRVVLLERGDAVGRHGKELASLRAAGVDVEVAPGVAAALGEIGNAHERRAAIAA